MHDHHAVTEAKRHLREAAKARRSQLSLATRTEAGSQLASHGLDFLSALPTPLAVSAFLAIGEEINPALLMSRLHRGGAAIGLPVMVGKGKPLEFRTWSPGAPLVTRMWGIREPDQTAPLLEPDVLLVPLLAFDRTGQRLGYGGGFYDRTLQHLRARRSVVAVGLAFASQEVDAVPHLDYDQRLDWVLTPEGPIRCSV
jgi:5-formyltetrahydrofolate cyclo-ligase